MSNPDDFALRFKGISATSDGTWEDFEKGEESGSSREQSSRDLKIERF